MELDEFFPERCINAKSSVSDTIFGEAGEDEEPIDMTNGERDWAGYDEDAEESVAIYEFKSRFVASSKK